MAKNKSKRKRAKLKREDYRKGGRVTYRKGDLVVEDFQGRPGDLVANYGPSSIPVNTGPGFVTGTGQTREDYMSIARKQKTGLPERNGRTPYEDGPRPPYDLSLIHI